MTIFLISAVLFVFITHYNLKAWSFSILSLSNLATLNTIEMFQLLLLWDYFAKMWETDGNFDFILNVFLCTSCMYVVH
jgi:hypothetical protein